MLFIKRYITMVLLAFMTMFVSGCQSESVSEIIPSKTTLMVYMCGSSLETKAGSATQDLKEMMAAMPTDDSLEIIVLAAGSSEWREDLNVDAEAANIYTITASGLEIVDSEPSSNMGDPTTLSRFLDFGYEHCQADHYALLIWDHGAGPMMGVCFDERFTSENHLGDSLSLTELNAALSDSPFSKTKLSWIGFDACLMASVETAITLEPYAEYMIASEEIEPEDGWNYSFITDIAQDRNGAETGNRVAAAYEQCYQGCPSDITLSCIDLSKMQRVSDEMTTLFGGFQVNKENYNAFAAVRYSARGIGKLGNYDLVDFLDLLEIYEEKSIADCRELREALQSAIVCNLANGPFFNGLSLYYPFTNKSGYISPWANHLEELDISEGYRAFIRENSSIWLGESLANWSKDIKISSDSNNQVIMELDKSQLEQFGGAKLIVLEESVMNKYHLIYSSDDVELRGNNLTCKYSGEALFAIDDDRTPKSSSINYSIDGDDLYTNAILALSLEESQKLGLELGIVSAKLHYRRQEPGIYKFVEAYPLSENILHGKNSFGINDFTGVCFGSGLKILTRDKQGNILPYSEWQKGHTVSLQKNLDSKTAGTLTLLPLNNGYNRWAMFEITDLQGNTRATDMIPLSNDYRMGIPVTQQILLKCPACTVTLKAAEIIFGAHPKLELIYTAENHTNESIQISFMEQGLLDNTMMKIFDPSTYIVGTGFTHLDAGEKKNDSVAIMPDVFHNSRKKQVKKLTVSVKCEETHGIDKKLLGIGTVEIPLKMDTILLVPDISDNEILDSKDWNGIKIELLSTNNPYSDEPGCLIHFYNPLDQPVIIGWYEFLINEMPVFVDVDGEFIVPHDYDKIWELPARCDTYKWISFTDMLNEQAVPERIESIGFRIFCIDNSVGRSRHQAETILRFSAMSEDNTSVH